MDSSSSSNTSDDQMIRMDVESNTRGAEVKAPRLLLRVWRVPVPLRKGYLVSDLFKNIACVMTLM
jgi:hypothetical protein